MSLMLELVNFFLALVVVAMAYMEYRTTKDRMFMFLADSFAFFAVTHLAIILGLELLIGEIPVIAVRILAYLVVIYGIYAQSRIYQVIK